MPGGVTLASYGLAAVAVSVALIGGIDAPAPDYLQFWTIGRAMPIASYHTIHEQPLSLDSRGDPATARLKAFESQLATAPARGLWLVKVEY